LLAHFLGIVNSPVDLKERLATMLLTLSGANDKVLNLKTELANFDRLNPQVA
jgi:hypothetical protein